MNEIVRGWMLTDASQSSLDSSQPGVPGSTALQRWSVDGSEEKGRRIHQASDGLNGVTRKDKRILPASSIAMEENHIQRDRVSG